MSAVRITGVFASVLMASMLLYPIAASAAVPTGMLNPGTYAIQDYENGVLSAPGSLVVSDTGSYTQTLNVGSGQIEMWLTQPTGSTDVYLQQIYLGGLFFTSSGDENSPDPVLYRRYVAPGVLLPGDSWGFERENSGTSSCPGSISSLCTLYSTSGGVTLTANSQVISPETMSTSSGDVVAQEVDTTLTLGGNASGTIQVVQYEMPGDPSRFRSQYLSVGSLNFLGQDIAINSVAVLGNLGGLPDNPPPLPPVGVRAVDIKSKPDGSGYWVLYADGTVVPGGNASYFGSGTQNLSCQCFVAMASTPSGKGYWLLTNQGAPYTFGDAQYLGGANQPPYPSNFVDIESTASGMGYWILDSYGAPYSFGNATYHGGANAPPWPTNFVRLAPAPPTMVGGVITDPSPGYWIMSNQGAPYSFGSAQYAGGTNQPPYPSNYVDIAPTRYGNGYWILDSYGAAYTFGNAQYLGGANAPPYPSNFVAMAPAGPTGIGPVSVDSMTATAQVPTGPAAGYWIVDSAGDVYSYGSVR